MTNLTKFTATTAPDPVAHAAAAEAAAFHQLMNWGIWICGSAALMLMLLWFLRALFRLTNDSAPRRPQRVSVPQRPRTGAMENRTHRAAQILSRSARRPAADALQRLLDEDLAPMKRDQVQRICEAIESAAASFEQLPLRMHTVVTDDGTTPRQDYDTVLDLAGNAIDAMTREEASVEIDQIRALRLYAQQWAAPSERLSVGGRGQTEISRPKGKS